MKRIDEYKALIDSRRPLKPEEVGELDAYFRIGTTYSSNALEGNTLTLSETKVLLEDGITVGGSRSATAMRLSATPAPTTTCWKRRGASRLRSPRM